MKRLTLLFRQETSIKRPKNGKFSPGIPVPPKELKQPYRLAQYYFDRQKSADAEKEINLFIEAGTSHQYWLARAFILLADINIAKKENFQAKQYLLSLQNNYNAQDDIQNMIENRLKQIGK